MTKDFFIQTLKLKTLNSICYRPAVLLLVALLLLWPAPAAAHSGPPFIVVPEQAIGPYVATIWADPDVGLGTFIVEATANGAATPQDTAITVWARPANNSQPEISAQCSRESTNDGKLFQTTLPLASEGEWAIRVTFSGPAGQTETAFQVTATPAWSGWITNTLCFLPFVALAGLWVYGVRRQRRAAAATEQTPAA